MQILDTLINWARLHPDYAITLTFLTALAESIIVVGGLIPGSFAITGIGILAGSGVIGIYSNFIAALLGAIVGDTGSYLVGVYFKENLKNFFFFRYYPRTLKVGKNYFTAHGGKSVFFGRFIGPVRAIVPAVAGMMGMPLLNFLFANILSALGWSALFFVPGVLIGQGHAQIKNHLQQIVIIVLVLIVPIMSVKIFRNIKLNIYKHFREKILKKWQIALQNPYLQFLTPNKDVAPTFKTATELTYLCLITGGLILSILVAKPFVLVCNVFLPIWLKYKPSLEPLLTQMSFINNMGHFTRLSILFFIFILVTRHYRLFISWIIIMLLGSGINELLLLNHHARTFNPLILSLGIQYLWLRMLVSTKPLFYISTLVLLVIAWNIDTIFLTVKDQSSWLTFVFAGLWIGQIAWLHARFGSIQISHKSLWLLILLLEVVLPLFI